MNFVSISKNKKEVTKNGKNLNSQENFIYVAFWAQELTDRSRICGQSPKRVFFLLFDVFSLFNVKNLTIKSFL